MWSWGRADEGRLGDGSVTAKSSPVQIGALTDWDKISGGHTYLMAIKNDKTLWGFGRNTSGQLGDSTILNKSSPVQVGADVDWLVVNAGFDHTLVVKEEGSLWAMGDNNPDGQLGDGTVDRKSFPVQIGALLDWALPGAGTSWSGAIKKDGTFWSWGSATNGRLGNSTTTPSISSPVQVGALKDWSIFTTSTQYALALKGSTDFRISTNIIT